MWAVPRLCEFYLGVCLTTEEKARKNLSQGKKNLSRGTVYILPKHPHIYAYFYSKTNTMHNFSSLLNITLHVSVGLSVHYQKSKTVHIASGICHTGSADCLLAGTRWNTSSISFPLASSPLTCMTYT